MYFSMTEADKLVDALFTPEKNRLGKFIEYLLGRHNEINKTAVNAFSHNGQVFNRPGYPYPTTSEGRPTLASELWPELEGLTKDYTQLSKHRTRIRQALTLAFSYCTSRQEVRDTLPDFMWEMFKDHQDTKRINEIGYIFKDRPLALEQFMKTVELMEFYKATALLY